MRFVTIFVTLLLISHLSFGKKTPVYKAKATYYGKKFTHSKTYSGERYNALKYTAAHKSFPLQSLVRVTNSVNNKSVIVRINDRFRRKNVIDLSLIAAKQLDIIRTGVGKVTLQLLDSSYLEIYNNQRIDSTLIIPENDSIRDSLIIKGYLYYYVRIASTKMKVTANKIVKQVANEYELKAKISKATHKRKPLYKVVSGPFATKEEAEKVIHRIHRRFKDAVIVED